MSKHFRVIDGGYRKAPRSYRPGRGARADRRTSFDRWLMAAPLLLFAAILWGPEWLAGEGIALPGLSAAAPSGPGERLAFSKCHRGGGINCVVDGDTIWMHGEKIRLPDIDTPETHPPRCAREAELGAAATNRLHALLNGGAVSVSRDGTDRYGRTLARVYVNGAPVGDRLIAEGLARPYGNGRRPWC